jgi:hypothetical protein
MFWAFTVGLALLVTGTIGYDVRDMHGFFHGGHWVNAPVWWQIASGLALLLLGGYWFRQLGDPGWTASRTSADPNIKTVGHGETAAAAQDRKQHPSRSEPPSDR